MDYTKVNTEQGGDIELAAPNVTLGSSNGFSEMLDELPSAGPSSPTKRLSFSQRNITWNKVNFNVGDKSILSNCWGKVSDGFGNFKASLVLGGGRRNLRHYGPVWCR